ncbi:hypothetical protein [Tessaracoccus sp. OH4464_COT-324]|uniref:hypothetical protein n=1 Tax=Tessaracoccus sp. OH4464_COT-324 TaxID=2491059 RepID=UPI000F62CA12|nr:hypothetical protein [Tessaracoccus sp. OH4464_COT-324]RRD47212.1 hypothetical protein EII42_04315 [Tessaracoccus sp. OH4464_COT-324]
MLDELVVLGWAPVGGVVSRFHEVLAPEVDELGDEPSVVFLDAWFPGLVGELCLQVAVHGLESQYREGWDFVVGLGVLDCERVERVKQITLSSRAGVEAERSNLVGPI